MSSTLLKHSLKYQKAPGYWLNTPGFKQLITFNHLKSWSKKFQLENLFYHEDTQALEQTAQTCCAVSVLGGFNDQMS